MVKISGAGVPLKDHISSGVFSSKSGSGQISSAAETFKNTLKDSCVRDFDRNLRDLSLSVEEAGKEFMKHPDEDSLNLYKETVKLFVSKFKEGFLSLKEEFGAKHDGETKLYVLLEEVEEQAAAAARDTLTESKAIGLLGSLDEIRGLVIDILG